MAQYDIMPLTTGRGGDVPVADVFFYPLAASESFTVGEPVSVNAAGNLTESASNPADEYIIGIAAMSGDTVGATDLIGTFRKKKGMFTPGASPNLPVVGDLTAVWKFSVNSKFVFRRFATDGSGTAAVPTKANAVGEVAGLVLASGNWFIDTGASSKTFRIIQILDANNEDIAGSLQTGVRVVAVPIAHQLTSVDAPVA